MQSIHGCDSIFELDLRVNPITVINSITASSAVICDDDELKIEIDAIGANLVYHWYKDSVLLPNERNKEYLVSDADKTNSGRYYVEVSGSCGDAKSKTITIDVRGAKNVGRKMARCYFGK